MSALNMSARLLRLSLGPLSGGLAQARARAAAPLAPARRAPLAPRRAGSAAAAAASPAASTPASPPGAPSASEPPTDDVVAILRARGLLADVTSPELGAVAARERLSVYCGFDPTAESLHLGNLLGVVVLAWFQRCGHRPVALVGGATARVGDPSGKSAERPLLDAAALARNTAGVERSLRALLTPPAPGAPPPLIVNNLEWWGPMALLDFLRDVGKAARVGTMVAKESVRRRLDSPEGLSFTEFTYQLLQGYDFVHLRRAAGVRVQVGGSDQWGNITAGTELIRKLADDEERAAGGAGEGGGASLAAAEPPAFGATFPLLLKADGTKFGKSESGAIWLSADKLSPYRFYQALLATADADAPRLLRQLTFVPLEELATAEAAAGAAGAAPGALQRALAEEVTRWVHGEAGLVAARAATAALAPGAAAGTALDAAALEAVAGEAPSAELPRGAVLGAPLADVMVAAGLAASKGAVRRLIKGGGVSVNNAKVAGEDELRVVGAEDLIDGRLLLVAAGKKNKMLIRVVG